MGEGVNRGSARALVLEEPRRFEERALPKLTQAAFDPPMVAVAVAWRYVFNREGVVNWLLGLFGGDR